MFLWKSKKLKKLKKKSQTPGSQKTLACQATTSDRFFAKRSRSYKHRNYSSWGDFLKVGSSKIHIKEL